MGVFDPRQGQVLPSPVTNFYKGKAIRQELELNQAREERADEYLEIQKKNTELNEKRLELQQEQFSLNAMKFAQEVGQEQAEKYAQDLFARIYAIDEGVQKGDIKSQDEALRRATATLVDYASSLPEEMAQPIMDKLQDGLTIEEYRQIKAANIAGLGQYGLLATKDKEEKDVKKQNFYDRDGNPTGSYMVGTPEWMEAMRDPGQFIGGDKKQKGSERADNAPLHSPPSNAEIETAEALIKRDETLEDLPKKERDIASRWLATKIKKLQRENSEIDYDEAAVSAIAELKTKVRDDPGMFNADRKKFNLGGEELGENEFLGKDGIIYIKNADGSFSRKN